MLILGSSHLLSFIVSNNIFLIIDHLHWLVNNFGSWILSWHSHNLILRAWNGNYVCHRRSWSCEDASWTSISSQSILIPINIFFRFLDLSNDTIIILHFWLSIRWNKGSWLRWVIIFYWREFFWNIYFNLFLF